MNRLWLLIKFVLLVAGIALLVPQDVWRDMASRLRPVARPREHEEFDETRLLPPAELPMRQADFHAFPRKGFGFVIEAPTGARIDTFRGVVTNGSANPQVPLRLSSAEMDSIYQAMIAMHFFDLPEPSPRHPYSWGEDIVETWVVHAGSVVKTLKLPAAALSGRSSDDWKRLYRLHNMVWVMVRRKPAWRTLPAREIRMWPDRIY